MKTDESGENIAGPYPKEFSCCSIRPGCFSHPEIRRKKGRFWVESHPARTPPRITLGELVSRIAVIGSGISGLTVSYYLSRKHEVSLFEREERIGGHTHTVTVESSNGPLFVDTGFIVHNDRTYPNLIRLLQELGVPRVNSDMSFAVSCRRTGYEYSSRGLRGYFAQRRNILRPSAYALFGEIKRFNRIAPLCLDRTDAAKLKVGDLLDEHRFTHFFREFYLFPMASAIWSCAHSAVKEFPAVMLARFFQNHGMLTINGHPQWKTIPGGCSRYIDPITAPYKPREH